MDESIFIVASNDNPIVCIDFNETITIEEKQDGTSVLRIPLKKADILGNAGYFELLEGKENVN